MLDMTYNLGINGLMRFKKMMAAISCRDYELAALEMKNSKWYKQVGDRSKRLCEMMKSDDWPGCL